MDNVDFPFGFDRRVAHGHSTKQEILAAAVEVASREGLNALTIGRLSRETGLSKAGVFAHFGSKLQLQLDTVDTVYGQFATEVTSKSVEAPEGKLRFVSFVSLYADFEASDSPSGCFFTRVIVEQAHHGGEVRKRLVDIAFYWNALLVRQLEIAKKNKEISADTNVEKAAFETMSMLRFAGLHYELTGDARVFEYVRESARSLVSK